MMIYAISDPHLSSAVQKPMNIFGQQWDHHPARLFDAWDRTVLESDLIVVPGDISWGMKLQDALPDLCLLDQRPGLKLLTKGNHDYWWPNKKRDFIIPAAPSLRCLHGRAWRKGRLGIAATRAWKIPGDSWFSSGDEKLYEKELGYLEDALKGLGDAAIRICALHYPPFNDRKQPGAFIDLLKRYHVHHVIHGHLHGVGCEEATVTGLHDGIHFHLTSCDYLDFTPIPILEIQS